jgi:hypothetical protein
MSALTRARSYIVGTPNFVSQRAALRYFAMQGHLDPWSAVTDALASGTIEIGRPSLADPRAIDCYPGRDGRYRIVYLDE